MSRLSMRRAVADDLPRIIALLADDPLGKDRDDPTQAEDPVYQEAFAAIDGTPNELLAVAELDGTVIGTLQLTFLPGLSNRGAWSAMVEDVRIDSRLRGGGLGAEMMDWAFAQCRARECRSVILKSHRARTDAHRFYEKLGFRASHVGMTMPLS